MELAVTLLIVAVAAGMVLRKGWRLVQGGGKAGCGSGCGSCPSNGTGVTEKALVTLQPARKREG